MKILTYTTLYPNNVNPNNSVFIKERMTKVAESCELKVVAPVPYFPDWEYLKSFKRWYAYSQVLPKEQRDGLEVYHPRYFITPKLGMDLYGWLMYRSTLNIVQRIQESFPFDIIDAHYIYPDGLAAVLIGEKLNKPVILSARGTDINLYPKFPLIRQQIRFALKKCTHIITVCQALKDRIIDLGIHKNKVSVIPNGVDTEKFYPISQARSRSMLGLPKERNIVVSVGRLVEVKGFHHLIFALKLCITKSLTKFIKPMLVIVGEGSHRSVLESQIQELGLDGDVILAGKRPHKEIVIWYNAANLFCLPSSSEGWPNVLLEALACGKPVVATKVGGIPEVICSPQYGILVDEQSPEAIANGILKAQNTEWDYSRIIEYAQRNTWENVAQKVYKVCQYAIKR